MKDLYALFRQSLAGLRLLVAATLVLGIAYPVVVWGVSSVVAPWQARGSLVTASGEHTTDPDEAVGSEIIGQLVDDEGLFLPRPSAAGDGYDMLSTYGSNYGPEAPELIAVDHRPRRPRSPSARVSRSPRSRRTRSPPPAPGSTPHISVEYAELQAPRVAAAQGLTVEQVLDLVDEHTSGRTLGVLGEPHVNVLMLNIAVRELAAG